MKKLFRVLLLSALFVGAIAVLSHSDDKNATRTTIVQLKKQAEKLSRSDDYTKAVEKLKEGLKLSRDLHDGNLTLDLLQAIGNAYSQQFVMASAIEYFKRALEHVRKTGKKTSIAGTLNAKAKVHLVLGELSEAEKLFEISRVLYRESGSINVMHPINYLGDILFQSGRYDESLKNYRKSLKIAQSLKSFNYIIEMNFKIGRAYEGKREFKKALNHYFNAINEVESIRAHIGGEKLKTGFMSGYLEIYERAVALLLNLHEKSPHKGHNKEAFHLAEKAKARAFLDSLQEVAPFSVAAGGKHVSIDFYIHISPDAHNKKYSINLNLIHPNDGNTANNTFIVSIPVTMR